MSWEVIQPWDRPGPWDVDGPYDTQNTVGDWYWPLRNSIDPVRQFTKVTPSTFARTGTATYVDNNGIIQTAAQNVPRFENGTFLQEPAGTNLVSNSEDFSGWNNTATSVAQDVTGPDGVLNSATTFTDDNTGAGDHRRITINPATDNAVYTGSVFVKEGSAEWFTIRIRDDIAGANRAEIDFQWVAGVLTVGAEDNGTGAVERLGSSVWWRAIVFTPASVVIEANSHTFRLYPSRNGVQEATTTIFFGAEVKESPVTDSYIPTSGAPATRNTESGNPYWTAPTDLFAESLGSEVITNGDFAADTDWIKGTGWSIAAGVASCDGSQVANSDITQLNTNLNQGSGVLWKWQFTVSGYAAGTIQITSGDFGSTAVNADGTYTYYGAVTAGGGNLNMRANSAFIGSIDNVSVKEVTNAWDGMPPHGTMVVYARWGYAYDDAPINTSSAVVSVNNAQNFFRNRTTGTGDGFISSSDSSSQANKSLDWAADTTYKLAIQWGILNSNVSQFRVGVDDGAGGAISWGSWTNFDGAYTVGGNELQIGYDLFSRMHVSDLRLYRYQKDPDEVS